MNVTGKGLETFFATPERAVPEDIGKTAVELEGELLLKWFDAIPASVLVINQYRQIVYCNKAFSDLSLKHDNGELLGMRPGEALDCVNAHRMAAGCGCSDNCTTCGAAQAIVKALSGTNDIQNCRLTRVVDGAEVPLDLQVYTTPIEFRDERFVFLFAMDISHELRLRYLSRVFHHGLVNTAGSITTMTELMEADKPDNPLFPMLMNSSRRIIRDVVYSRDLEAAEAGTMLVRPETFGAEEFLKNLIDEECRIRNTQPAVVEVEVEADNLSTDKRIVGHIIRNMLVNALEAREQEGGQILLSCHADGSGTVISMTNNGEIPDDIRKQMFKRYVSTKSRDRGLGTYVMKLFGERYLSGKVAFDTGEGTTTFSITLP